MSSVVTINWKK